MDTEFVFVKDYYGDGSFKGYRWTGTICKLENKITLLCEEETTYEIGDCGCEDACECPKHKYSYWDRFFINIPAGILSQDAIKQNTPPIHYPKDKSTESTYYLHSVG